MTFSLITVTMGREPEMQRLRESLARQTFRDFEHIVIDQREHPELRGGLSRARNLGLRQARGEIVAFPDDDAWYGPTVLEDVLRTLQTEKADGVSCRVTDAVGTCSAGGWMSRDRKWISPKSIWHTAVSCSFFVRRQALQDVEFDGELGVGAGTRFGSGEETDFLLKLIEQGARIFYDGRLTVFHPLFNGRYAWGRGWRYGNGYGCVLRRHGYSLLRLGWAVAVQLARCGQSLLTLKFSKATFHLGMATGRMAGYLI